MKILFPANEIEIEKNQQNPNVTHGKIVLSKMELNKYIKIIIIVLLYININ